MSSNNPHHIVDSSSGRIKFASARKRSKQASADVYRSYKRHFETNEERVHHGERKRSRKSKHISTVREDKAVDVGDVDLVSTLAEELDVAMDRNASEVFASFHRQVWPLVRSLPEILHHAGVIIQSLNEHLLSPVDRPGDKSDDLSKNHERKGDDRLRYIPNHATLDLLHLYSVLARDLRHELHPFLHSHICPRLIWDLLNPPSNTDPPIDVSLVEATFRTLSYIFKYDSIATHDNQLESLRQYYGLTIAHKRQIVRRLAAETFAPIIRQLHSDGAKRRHLRRVVRALGLSATSTTPRTRRLQSDAIDGIAELFSQVARGVRGKLHSKGGIVLDCLWDCLEGEKSVPVNEAIYSVAIGVIDRLLQHLEHSEASKNVLTPLMNRALKISKDSNAEELSLTFFVQVITFAISYRSGAILLSNREEGFGQVTMLLSCLFRDRWGTCKSGTLKEAIYQCLSCSWTVFPESELFYDELGALFTNIMVSEAPESSSNESCLFNFLVGELMPALPEDPAMKGPGSLVVSAAATLCQRNDSFDIVQSMIYSLVTVRFTQTKEELTDMVDDSDELHSVARAVKCHISKAEKTSLVSACVRQYRKVAQGDPADVATFAWLASFSSFVGVGEVENQCYDGHYEEICAVMETSFDVLSKVDEATTNFVVATALLTECFVQSSLLTIELSSRNVQGKVSKFAKRIHPFVTKFVDLAPKSLWMMKGAASFAKLLHKLGIPFRDDTDALLEQLIPNLQHRNHFVRLHALEILCTLPTKTFVVDYSDIDFSDDLDEEMDPSRDNALRTTPELNGPVGACNILKMLFEAESIVPQFRNERRITSMLSRVEVLGRTGTLPVLYAEAAASHLLGLLYTPFSPIWESAGKALAALARGHGKCVWPLIQVFLEYLIKKEPYRVEDSKSAEKAFSKKILHHPSEHFGLCLQLEETKAFYAVFFANELATSSSAGRISRHRSTDEESVLESTWKALEKAPNLIVDNSRMVVPIVLQFFQSQYFALNPLDPDARELNLPSLCDVKDDRQKFLVKPLSRGLINRRTDSILKVFAVIKGPEQLFKHKVLFQIYLSLLSRHDSSVCQTALACLLRYKIPYLSPYGELLQKLFIKNKFREALLDLMAAVEDGSLASEHRRPILPVVCRMLFGCLLARSSGAKSSKDTPAARRNAVLAFICSFCQTNTDIECFVYLMLRQFTPLHFETKPIEVHDDAYRTTWMHSLKELSLDECGRLPHQVLVGFLNVLEAVISKCGARVGHLIPSVLSVVLKITKLNEIKSSIDSLDPRKDEDEREEAGEFFNHGAIRGLCFRRLSDIFSAYGESIAVEQFTSELWDSVGKSLRILPSMAVHAEKPPALLILMNTLSSKPSLQRMLGKCDNAVASTMMCYAGSTRVSVADSVLGFLTNLIDDESVVSYADHNSLPNAGSQLLVPHIGLLVDQFNDRFQKDSSSRLWRQEVAVLCKLSSLVSSKGRSIIEGPKNIHGLCSVLSRFLSVKRGCKDEDLINIVDTLAALLPLLVSEEDASEHFRELSKLLGPSKGQPGIASKAVRASLASVIERLAQTGYVSAKPVAGIVAKLNATSKKRVDELDSDGVILVLGELAEESNPSTWHCLCGDTPAILHPIVNTCFHLLSCDDGVVARSAFRAIKSLIKFASSRDDGPSDDSWKQLLKGSLAPTCRIGLSLKEEGIRRYYILLVRELAFANRRNMSPDLHSDLAHLVNYEEIDLDFFMNITHVQLHRRARALQRLRKTMASEGSTEIGALSLSTVILPLALHPIYEVSSKGEEAFALEGVATVGLVSRSLSWNKYNNLLWTTLSQFERRPQQETSLVALVCTLIDSFPFDTLHFPTPAEDESGSNAVLRSLSKRFLPKLEALLVKEKIDKKSGEKIRSIRSPIVLAMVKLFRKFPEDIFKAKLPRVLSVVCDALKSRDSDTRDLARSTLSKISMELDIAYLADIVREIAVTLVEGYQLHVRLAALHSILLALSESEVLSPQREDNRRKFDSTVPAMIDIIQQDIFGTAQERKDNAGGNQIRFVKEAGGSKGLHSIELIASMISFRPSESSSEHSLPVHSLIGPFFQRLQQPQMTGKLLRLVKECLNRSATGLQRNGSVNVEEVLPFVFASLKNFVGTKEIESIFEESTDSDHEELPPLRVNGVSATSTSAKQNGDSKNNTVAVWKPSTFGSSQNKKDAKVAKAIESRRLRSVQDGALAPKLTGSNRNTRNWRSSGINDPATVSALQFGLQLLWYTLRKCRKQTISPEDVDPYIPYLTICVCECRDTEMVLLSLKCLGLLMDFKPPSLVKYSQFLTAKTLELLTMSGTAETADQEMSQAAFKMLTFLVNSECSSSTPGSTVDSAPSKLALNDEQMDVLLSFVKESLTNTEQHSPAVNLIKAIMSKKYMSAQLYDLMDTMLDLTVKSSKASLREQSGAILVSFLLDYPLSAEKIENYIRKITSNLKYEYEDGRKSAVVLLNSVTEKFPSAVLEKHCQLLVFSLSLQLVNDESTSCRELVAKCISNLLRRVSPEALQTLLVYTHRWADGDAGLRRMAFQLFGLFVESSPDLMKRGGNMQDLMRRIETAISPHEPGENLYFALLTFEKTVQHFNAATSDDSSIWENIVACMVHEHAWVRLTATRLLAWQISSVDPTSLSNKHTLFGSRPGQLYELARNLCFQLGSEEEEQNDDLIPYVVKSLTWALQAMDANPSLCFAGGSSDKEETKKRDPIHWLFTRLSNIARPPGTKRRQAVFKCFAAFASMVGQVALRPRLLELMLSPLHRVAVESESITSFSTQQRKATIEESEEVQLARDVLHLLEEQAPDGVFVKAYATIKKRAVERKAQRKADLKAEYIVDPVKAAQRRVDKQLREKKRRKRRVDEHRRIRGKEAKRRHLDPDLL